MRIHPCLSRTLTGKLFSLGQWQLFVFIGLLIVVGYFIHFVPFFTMERTLFIHHYLPALMFKILLIPILADHIQRHILGFVSIFLILLSIQSFLSFVPLPSLKRPAIDLNDMSDTLLLRKKRFYLSHNGHTESGRTHSDGTRTNQTQRPP